MACVASQKLRDLVDATREVESNVEILNDYLYNFQRERKDVARILREHIDACNELLRKINPLPRINPINYRGHE